jgi:hypothetical protein
MTTLADALNQYNARTTQQEAALQQVEEFLGRLQHPLVEYVVNENDSEAFGHLQWRNGHQEQGSSCLMSLTLQRARPARRKQVGPESYAYIAVPAEPEGRYMALFKPGSGFVHRQDWDFDAALQHVARVIGARLRREAIAARNQERNARTPITSMDMEAALASQRGFDL